ncbi:hypothetical protein V8C43DRAFT_309374 [Trichoderma afarasin]|uniref:Uncharacterized protein n=1 Tax=Trichoderma harzianum CBS 226.95 TaxID=983964 RepID=A0A2T4AJ27_TRIHA|nr:hypothetical protein M431DRAFT_529794 [Trichoderma harzianum CBS 226.95]KAK0767138.1 hypothetical protein N5P37_000872 [Trichoderma harzianum]PKK50373.1 hypothetical protein CI102_4748 [Trichoderma harzianum]PTB57085.1 hypothetical protein M431DRAFT_529794 [Trichoderma harzianum CBS 226.95]
MNSIEIKSVRSEDSSSSTSHVELIAAPVQPDPTETAPPEAPLPEEPPFGPVADFTMSSNNSTPTGTQLQARENEGTFLQREWQTIFRVGIVLLSIASGCLGGFLRHDANLGLGIGAGVLAGLLVLFEVLKHKLRRARQRLVSQSWWPTSSNC